MILISINFIYSESKSVISGKLKFRVSILEEFSISTEILSNTDLINFLLLLKLTYIKLLSNILKFKVKVSKK